MSKVILVVMIVVMLVAIGLPTMCAGQSEPPRPVANNSCPSGNPACKPPSPVGSEASSVQPMNTVSERTLEAPPPVPIIGDQKFESPAAFVLTEDNLSLFPEVKEILTAMVAGKMPSDITAASLDTMRENSALMNKIVERDSKGVHTIGFNSKGDALIGTRNGAGMTVTVTLAFEPALYMIVAKSIETTSEKPLTTGVNKAKNEHSSTNGVTMEENERLMKQPIRP